MLFCRFITRRQFFSRNQFDTTYCVLYTMTQEQNSQTVAISMKNVKELFREMIKEQEEALIKILSSCNDTLNQRLDKIALQVTTIVN